MEIGGGRLCAEENPLCRAAINGTDERPGCVCRAECADLSIETG